MHLPLDVREWEGVAAELSRSTGCDDAPVDAFELAGQLELAVEQIAPGALGELDFDRGIIRVDCAGPRTPRVHMTVAHEVGHFGLIQHRLHNDCGGARYIGGALMAPAAAYDRQLRQTAWALAELRRLNPNVSATALAVRITQRRDAVVTVLDPRGRRKPWRVASPWLVEPRLTARVSAWERELARQAYEAGTEIRGDELCYAVPLLDDESEHRVLVVCELEQLALRL